MSEMTMVELVALAISGGKDPASVLAIHRDRARLAIAAMREPSENLVCEGDERILRFLYDNELLINDSTPARASWQAMIDAALRESPGEPQAHQRARQEGR